MCQVGEDYGAPAPEGPPPPRPGCELKCVKCKEGLPVVVIRAGDAFCRDCFKAFYVHKFRAVLGKNRLIFPGEKVLLAWSGGPSSSSMVWQVLEGLSQDSAKRLRFVPGVVYVDEGAACGQSREDRAKTLAEVELVLQTAGLPRHVVALEEVFSLPPSVLRGLAQEPSGTQGAYKTAVDSFLQQQLTPGAEGPRGGPSAAPGEEQLSRPRTQDPPSPAVPPAAAQTEALSRLFGSVKTLTAKEELLQTLRTHLILHVARTHGYSKVMTGDSCTRLAIKLMTSLALGRGAFLAWDTGFSDERHGDVVVVRPMRDHTLKEVAFYNRLFGVPSVFTPAVDTKAPEKASIHRLTEAFMLRLQAQFPSTVSTVYRTSEKLVKAPRDGHAAGPPGPRCLLCICALDIDTADSATAFGAQTLNLSQTQPPARPAEARVPTGPCSSAGMDGAQGCCQVARPHGRGDPRSQVVQHLCYGCRVTVRDLPSLDPLPPYILAEAQLRSQRYRLTLYCGAPGGAFLAGAPGGCFPLSASPRALPQTQEALVQEVVTRMPVRAEPAASALDESRPPGPPSCGAGSRGWAEGT
ncbi:cytoplasmic tRNA 2-thiolation protein 2 isoform X3 [Manis pentadactyla]|uniref:cytoplasmic tRNA 2-thiolation protein 2 isoform X3 n=1 Tax=Manis pentadactyla TaxID=143292 RepID=UPI00255C8EEF|nr:cytoplasmic tRNA 2-thiolation protein 2 isoform X3 [Manis pentadactyla]